MGPLRAALIALMVATTGGCSLFHPTQTLVVHALPHANHDRQFYLVVRTVQDGEFVGDGYARIASLVFPAKPDPSVRLVRLVAPGQKGKVKLQLPADQPFAVYALFTNPGASWKALLTPPLGGHYDVVVDGDRLSVRGPDQKRAPSSSSLPDTSSLSAPDTSSLGAPDTSSLGAPELGR